MEALIHQMSFLKDDAFAYIIGDGWMWQDISELRHASPSLRIRVSNRAYALLEYVFYT